MLCSELRYMADEFFSGNLHLANAEFTPGEPNKGKLMPVGINWLDLVW